MITTGFRFAMVLLIVGAGLTARADAQETKSARGTVTAVGGDSITVKAADRELKFAVDLKTVLTASGAGTADRKAEAAGKPGLRVADFVKAGDAVEVSYQETGSTMRASNIRRISSAGSSGGSMSGDRAETANGTVDSISGTTLVISGQTGGGSFKQTFAVDATTQVVAVGASTAAAAKGGKVALTDFVGIGDQVTVSYRKAGSGLHADEVRVRAKGPKK
ncbi:MAG: DUF5666 domain-containing protein [Vicinamibacterales bacterium]